jgi:hypothetical protein
MANILIGTTFAISLIAIESYFLTWLCEGTRSA